MRYLEYQNINQKFYWLFMQQVQYVHETSVGYPVQFQDLFLCLLLYSLIIKFIDKKRVRYAKMNRFTFRGVKGNLPPVQPSVKIV